MAVFTLFGLELESSSSVVELDVELASELPGAPVSVVGVRTGAHTIRMLEVLKSQDLILTHRTFF